MLETTTPGTRSVARSYSRQPAVWLLALAAFLFALPALAQQTGEIAGHVTKAADGSAIPGVSIQATSPSLPGVRTTSTASDGSYRLPLLPTGTYTVVYSFPDGGTRTRETEVLLQQRATVNLAYGDAAEGMEEVVVTGATLKDAVGEGTISNSINNELFGALPVGQEYRDLIKLIPGVQLSPDLVRGPSAGGSGQDNSYQFDGVDVSLPFFGTLSAEPSTHDIEQVSIVRGGAKAVGFNRSGGFTVNTISKKGTNEFHGEVSYQFQNEDMQEERDNQSTESYKNDNDWVTASMGGPILQDQLFFYGSYYRPSVERVNSANVYGEVPNYNSVRDEYFGKLTWAPTENLLFDASFRTSDREVNNASLGAFDAPSVSVGEAASQDIGILEGSWIIDDQMSAYFKYYDYKNQTSGRPDNILDLSIAAGQALNINALDTQGAFTVPRPSSSNPVYNAFIQPYIDQYGYLVDGVNTGGGTVGGYYQFNGQDFYRESFELGWDLTMETDSLRHEFHAGWRWSRDEEDLSRTSNGWGTITIPTGFERTPSGQLAYFKARFDQMSLAGPNGATVPPIHSEVESHSVEINDTIYWQDWTFNLGLMMSYDELFGAGLRPVEGNVSGFAVEPGHKYRMKEIDWDEMLAPRLGVNWDFHQDAALFANYARYYPAATSLARAASWDRNLRSLIDAWFDADGNFIESRPFASSSGKIFQEDIDPRHIDEYLIGANWDITERFTSRVHARYRAAQDFWEDTNNNARVDFNPPAGIPRELYVPNLADIQAEIGGSSFVIAQLDGAETDYYELSLEGDYSGENWFLRASYTWSQYEGNFDQDNSTNANDDNIFIGSSNIADDPGRQLWDYREGTLRGDRPHLFKTYGYYFFPWNGRAGAYAVYQSGQPWETWSYEPYSGLTSNTSDTNRYAEPAGSRRSDSHWQMDLNYSQFFYLGSEDRYVIELRGDVFNVFDNQTGYDIEPRIHSSGYGLPRNYYSPRRLQLAAVFSF